jgi:hypothetical protein
LRKEVKQRKDSSVLFNCHFYFRRKLSRVDAFHLISTFYQIHLKPIMHPTDPVNLDPIPSLIDSYTYHSELPLLPDASTSAAGREGWMMGIDEAGRGRRFA